MRYTAPLGRFLRRARVRRRIGWRGTLLILAALAAGGALLLNAQFRPVAQAVSRSYVSGVMSQAIQAGIAAELAEDPVAYGDIITMEVGPEGYVTALESNMAAVNLLKARLIQRSAQSLEELSECDLRIPAGTLTGLDLLSGLGPGVEVRFVSLSWVTGEFTSQFSQAGLNQTLHRVMLELEAQALILLPGGQETVTVADQVCLAETVIVGPIPEFWLGTQG